MYGSWDITCKEQSFLSIWIIFLPSHSINNPKNQNFEKIKKSMEILFYTCVPQMICATFCATFCPFTPLIIQKIKIWKKWKKQNKRYYHSAHEYDKLRSYDVWFLRYGVRQTKFFLILDHFCPFVPPPPLTTQWIKILKKWKKP